MVKQPLKLDLDKQLHPTQNYGCNYLSNPWFQLYHVSKMPLVEVTTFCTRGRMRILISILICPSRSLDNHICRSCWLKTILELLVCAVNSIGIEGNKTIIRYMICHRFYKRDETVSYIFGSVKRIMNLLPMHFNYIIFISPRYISWLLPV